MKKITFYLLFIVLTSAGCGLLPKKESIKKPVRKVMTAPTTKPQEDWIQNASKKALAFSVSIRTFDQYDEPRVQGSGFLINNRIVTNHHVICGAHSAIVKLNSGREFRVVGIYANDSDNDFAVLRINAPETLPTAPFSSEKVEIGQPVMAIGCPEGLEFSISNGIVSSLRSVEGQDFIQTTAAVSPGSSGGPLVNKRGEVLGMITWQMRQGQNLNFAVPVKYFKDALSATRVQATLAQLARQEMNSAVERTLTDCREPGVYQVKVPTEWKTQRDRQWAGDTEVLTAVIAPEDAKKAELHGYVSKGIRIEVRRPQVGNEWREDFLKRWLEKELIQATLKANPTFALTSTETKYLSGQRAQVFSIVGQAKGLAPEKTVIYAIATKKALLSIELIAPTSDLELLDVLEMLLSKTFELELERK